MGNASYSPCNDLPCNGKFRICNRTFRLSILVHSACLNEVKPGMMQNARPYVAIVSADGTEETEFGDWSGEKSQWCFREIVTIETSLEQELSISVSSLTSCNLHLASVGFAPNSIGDVCIPVANLSQEFQVEDRDSEGFVYTTAVLPFDLTREGEPVGQIFLSFETMTQPSSVFRKCCGFGDFGISMNVKEGCAPFSYEHASTPCTRPT